MLHLCNKFCQCRRVSLFCPSAFVLKLCVKVPLIGQMCFEAKGTTLVGNIQAMCLYVREFGILPFQDQARI